MNKTAIARAMMLAVSLSALSCVVIAQERPSDSEASQVLENARPLAEQGNANAQYNMGVLYDEGYGVEQNYDTARSWYEKAAAQNYAKAEHNLGIMYQAGHGVSADPDQAAQWFKRAAEHGEPAAQNNLAVMYVRGQGVPQDLVEAARWAARAASAGNQSAITNLPEIVANLPRSRIDGDNVNIRSQPNTNAQVLRQAGRNTQVVVLDTRNDWAEVLFPKDYDTGWVAGFLLAGSSAPLDEPKTGSADSQNATTADSQASASDSSTDPDPSASASDAPTNQSTRTIGGNVVNIRARPTTNSDVVFQARRGDTVTVIGQDDDWREVRFANGRTGWVAGFLLVD
ncbi:SH3 domain-containing protein [Salinisphaera sp. T31B1]|uniref:SH3 domain-containing protein n=1 Tax=Salinisphaera sp. T31B1 TaxID=727963 RepID=UPI00333F9320